MLTIGMGSSRQADSLECTLVCMPHTFTLTCTLARTIALTFTLTFTLALFSPSSSPYPHLTIPRSADTRGISFSVFLVRTKLDLLYIYALANIRHKHRHACAWICSHVRAQTQNIYTQNTNTHIHTNKQTNTHKQIHKHIHKHTYTNANIHCRRTRTYN